MSEEGYLKPSGENPMADKIRKAIGASKNEDVKILFPQFHRTDGKIISDFPVAGDVQFFNALCKAPHDLLKDLGLQPWGEHDLWLFPAEWYGFMPEGYEVTFISGRKDQFHSGETDNDIRFGALAFGIVSEKGSR